MVPQGPGPDEGLARLLRSLPRREPPDLPIEAIFEQQAGRRRRRLLTGGVAAAAGLIGIALVLGSEPREAPVHLDLRVVDVTAEEASGIPSPFGAPEELAGP